MIGVLDYDVGTVNASLRIVAKAMNPGLISFVLMTADPGRCLEGTAWAPSGYEFLLRQSQDSNVSFARDLTESGHLFAMSLISRQALDGPRRRYWRNLPMASGALTELHSVVWGAGFHY